MSTRQDKRQMQSIRSRILIFLLKHRHWFRLRLKQETIDWNTSVPALRERVEKSAEKFGKLTSDIIIEPALIDDPNSEFIKIAGRERDDSLKSNPFAIFPEAKNALRDI